MSELEDRLNALLANPEDMGKIARMASRLMGEISPEPPAAGKGADGALLGAVSRIMGGLGGGREGNKNQLLSGMSPYLSEERRKRLGRALRIASAARLAGAALAEWGGEDGL